jgi:hypothetical protein
VGKTPLYLGQPVAMLIFEDFDTFDRTMRWTAEAFGCARLTPALARSTGSVGGFCRGACRSAPQELAALLIRVAIGQPLAGRTPIDQARLALRDQAVLKFGGSMRCYGTGKWPCLV